MKKLKFTRFLFRQIIGTLIITCTMIGLVYPFFIVIFGYMQDNTMLNIADSTKLSLSKGYINYGMNEAACKHYLTLNADFTDGFEVAMAVVDKDNDMKVIATSEEATTIIVKGDKPRVFICATDDLAVVRERNAELKQWVVIEDIYADGDYFYPGKVKIVNTDKYISGMDTEDDVYERFDFTPENTDAYEHIIGDINANFNFGTPSDSRALKFLEEHYINGNTSHEEDDEVVYNQHNFTLDGKNYKLYIVGIFDYISSTIYSIKKIYVGIILCALGIAIIMADVKYKKYCNQYEMDEFRRTMTSALAHDLKTPLTAIMGYAENLRDNVHSEKKEHYAEAVIENVKYMNSIITSTLDLAKLDIQEGVKAAETDITAIAEELISKYRANAEDRKIKFTVEGKCRIKADRELISRAVENLISNAVKYTPDGGEVKIIGSNRAFVVENTCDSSLKGGTDDFCKPFFKADESRSSRSGGGIGLAAVRNIAAMHGFKLDVNAQGGLFKTEIKFK
ncbi:MAG: HAMP domain-containing histidine kinase [Oscillospiraceae bacterium]|nr:HAMP domain-containing histidine kinase [Oscillospiraceae bacterium]